MLFNMLVPVLNYPVVETYGPPSRRWAPTYDRLSFFLEKDTWLYQTILLLKNAAQRNVL